MQHVRRLFEFFEPEHYDLILNLQREERTFSGTVVIHGKKTGGYEIMLHAKELHVASVLVDDTSVDFTHEDDELTICPNFTPGDYTITVTFDGKITDPMHGLYTCYYDVDGVKKELLATQFESHHAREVFPCVDEPEAKATFDLTLTTEPNVTVLSNMPALRTQNLEHRTETVFERSPRMSTYLLAFVVGELQKKTATSRNGVKVNVWATKDQEPGRLDFALDIATRAVDFYDEYFGTTYPLPKADHVALPDFSSGAMENWGLITYRTAALLAEPDSAYDTKKFVASVIVHELSHQWFGNLVTMRWWNNLWLNESFASVMEYVCVDALEPNWHVWDDVTMQESMPSLKKDALSGVQAVQTEVKHPDEISTLFDPAIVYAKGAKLMRMMLSYVGPEAFRKALKNYFAEHAYQNTEANDLWAAMTKASGKDVGRLMNAWISQPGYPVIKVTDKSLSQHRFFVGEHEKDASLWPVPLFANSEALPEILANKKFETDVPIDLLLNTGDRANFVTLYSPTRLSSIAKLIAKRSLPAVERLRLLNEQALLADAEELESGRLVTLLRAYTGESDDNVVSMVAVVARSLGKFVENDSTGQSHLRKFCRELVSEQFARLGWEQKPGEAESDTKLRSNVLNLVVHGRNEDDLRAAATIYTKTPLEQIDANNRISILRAAIILNEENEFKKLMAIYRETNSPDLRNDIMYSASLATSPSSVRTMLDGFQNGTIRAQDAKLWFMLLMSNPENRSATWRWLVENWVWIEKKFSGDKTYEVFVQRCGNYFVTREELYAFNEFFNNKQDIPALSRAIDIARTEITARVKLVENQAGSVKKELLK